MNDRHPHPPQRPAGAAAPDVHEAQSMTPRHGVAVHKGRGALSNATGRFERITREDFDDGWGDGRENDRDDGQDHGKDHGQDHDRSHDDLPPPKLRTTLTPDTSRRIISYNASPDLPSTAPSIRTAAASTGASTATRGRATRTLGSHPASTSRPKSYSSRTRHHYCARNSANQAIVVPRSRWGRTPTPTSRSSATSGSPAPSSRCSPSAGTR